MRDHGGAAVIHLRNGASEGVYVTSGGIEGVEVAIGAPAEPLAKIRGVDSSGVAYIREQEGCSEVLGASGSGLLRVEVGAVETGTLRRIPTS